MIAHFFLGLKLDLRQTEAENYDIGLLVHGLSDGFVVRQAGRVHNVERESVVLRVP